jgi:hypothetical protein
MKPGVKDSLSNFRVLVDCIIYCVKSFKIRERWFRKEFPMRSWKRVKGLPSQMSGIEVSNFGILATNELVPVNFLSVISTVATLKRGIFGKAESPARVISSYLL